MSANRSIPFQPLSPSTLPKLSASAVRANASIALRRAASAVLQEVARDVGEELGCDLRLSARLLPRALLAAELHLRPHSCPLVLECDATGESLLLELETPIASAMLERLSGGEGIASLPGELHEADLAAAAYLALVALAAVRKEPLVEETLAIRLAETGSRAEASRCLAGHREWLAIEISVELPRARGTARLLLPSPTVDRLCARAGGSPAAQPTQSLLARELRASLRTGAFSLDAAELEALREGDVVLVTGAQRSGSGLEASAELRFSTFTLRGDLSGFAFTLASIVDAASAEAAMKPTAQQSPPPLPVELKVELAQLRVPLSGLAALEPGSVLRLGMTLSDQVTLLLGDAPFARAELVDVGGELGARVLELIGGGR